MLIQTKGIVFKSVKYSETSLICSIYTRKLGLQQYIINGVRSKSAKAKANFFRPMNILDLIVYNRSDKAINRLKEFKFEEIYQNIPFDLVRGTLGLFMTEVCQKTIKEKEENSELFDFLHSSFSFLDASQERLTNFPIYFMIQLSSYLGFMPRYEKPPGPCYFDQREGIFCSEKPNHHNCLDLANSDLLYLLLGQSYSEASQLKLTKADREQFLRHLIEYYQLHVEGLQAFNSPAILKEVLQ